MKLLRILTAALVAVFMFVTFSFNVANAAGTYKISCKNDAYGMQLGSDYTAVAYVYTGLNVGLDGTNLGLQYLIRGGVGAYVGNDCLYAGAADTNGTAVVSADVARLAVNAIVGAVTNRIDMAYAAKASGASATGLSFTTQSDGLSMSANRIIGGLSFWADTSSTDFENTQTFTNVRLDSMAFTGDATSYSLGVDKAIGKALIGVVVSNLDTDLVTTFNSGTYKQDIDTVGIYAAYRTKYFQIDLGTGSGDSNISTTRRDLGNDSVINGSTTADVEYTNARIAANYSRGRFTIMPSASFRTMQMDIAGFTDVRASETSTITGDGELFSAGNTTLTTTDDTVAARSVETETMSIGIKLTANLGYIMPYLDFSYDTEDTTNAAYKVEAGTDGTAADLKATNYETSTKIGGGIDFMLGSHIKGGIRAGSINSRENWNENYAAGSISVGF